MKVSRESWHYRLMDQFDFYHPRNLCSYFWMTVWCLLICVAMLFGASLFVFIASLPLWWWTDPNAPFSLVIIVGTIEIIVLSALFCVMVDARHIREIDDGTRKRPEIAPYVHKEPGLFALWLKAKHDKICPLIDFE